MEGVDYFEHDADIGVIGCGSSVGQAFERAAAAMFAVMTDLAVVKRSVQVAFDFEEADLELALVIWLNRLLAEARARGLIFGHFQLRRDGDNWHGTAWGEPWRSDLERGVEVKGATLTMLSVREWEGQWEARCIVDV